MIQEVKGWGSVYSKKAKLKAFKNSKILPTLKQAEGEFRSIDDLITSLYYGDNLNQEPSLKGYKEDLAKVSPDKRLKNILVWDTETTGRDAMARAVSFGAVLFDLETQEIKQEVYFELNPEKKIDPDAYKIHKISNNQVKDAPLFSEKYEELKKLFRSADMMVGQNLAFDIRILHNECERFGLPNVFLGEWFDTLKASVKFFGLKNQNGKGRTVNLEEALSLANIDKPEGEYHNAMTDSKATLQLFLKMINI